MTQAALIGSKTEVIYDKIRKDGQQSAAQWNILHRNIKDHLQNMLSKTWVKDHN